MLILISGALANRPSNGGGAWVRLSWLRGFERLGCQIYFLEQIRSENCVDANGAPASFENSVNLAYFQSVTAEFGLAGRAALICDDGSKVYGASLPDLEHITQSADLLVNITGHLTIPRLFQGARRKAYIDIDPGFTQYWHDAGVSGAALEGHDLYYTIGENIGNADCPIPTAGFDWRPIRQPVVLEDWPIADRAAGLDRFTTIASGRGTFGPVDAGGHRFGLKVHEFRKVFELPQRTGLAFEIALDIHPGDSRDRDALSAHSWRIVDPRRASGSPADFRRYVQQSGAEFSVAQGIYVETNSGWFSDRTVRYLASGRPALVQDTGFSQQLRTGLGLVTFRTLDEAVEGAQQVAMNYEAHALAARAIAEEYFDSSVVLPRLLDDAKAAP
jgi:hypothetical protein